MTTLLTRVVLARPHTHAGQAYPAGTALEVELPLAAWLCELGIAAPEPPQAQSEPEQKSPLRKDTKR